VRNPFFLEKVRRFVCAIPVFLHQAFLRRSEFLESCRESFYSNLDCSDAYLFFFRTTVSSRFRMAQVPFCKSGIFSVSIFPWSFFLRFSPMPGDVRPPKRVHRAPAPYCLSNPSTFCKFSKSSFVLEDPPPYPPSSSYP